MLSIQDCEAWLHVNLNEKVAKETSASFQQ